MQRIALDVLQIIKHVWRISQRLHIKTFRSTVAAALPPKSGLNRMSYPFISLSTVSFTRGMLLGSLISLMLRREDGVKYLANTTHTPLKRECNAAEANQRHAKQNTLPLAVNKSPEQRKDQKSKVIFPDPPHRNSFEVASGGE